MTAPPRAARVTAPDDTRLSVSVSGEGRALLAIHGTSSYHGTWQGIRSLLERQVQLWALDRRGRGGSGDGTEYSIEHEYDDVAAVIDAAARETGRSVDVLGHSFGGNVA